MLKPRAIQPWREHGGTVSDEPMRTEIEAALLRHSAWPFTPTLEALFVEQRGPSRRARLARGLQIVAALVLGTLVLDWLNGEFLLPTLLGRLGATLCCAGGALGIRRSTSQHRQTVFFVLPLLLVMVTTEYLAENVSPRLADRYMMGAIIAIAGPLVTLPLSASAAVTLAVSAIILFPVVPALHPGAMPLLQNLDVVVFACGSFGVAGGIALRNEIGRRGAFLRTLRDRFMTAELNLLNSELMRLSTTDDLTGIANRRHFESELARHWADRRATDIGVALIDVDNFKAFNDSAGHAAGDACLRQVARALAGALRHERDLVARYGGEEFAVLLPGIPPQDLQAMGARLHHAVAVLRTAHPGLPGQQLSVSVGLAFSAAASRGSTPEALLREADRALYAAKAAGRDRVVG